MRIRIRAAAVIFPALLWALACAGGDRCLNPQPDLPCGSNGAAMHGAGGVSASAGSGSGALAGGSGGSTLNIGDQPAGGPGSGAAGSSSESAGAGGDSAVEGGAGGDADLAAGAAGAAASSEIR